MNSCLSFALTTLLTSAPAFAAGLPAGDTAEKLVTLTSSKDTNIYNLEVLVDAEGHAAGMYNSPDPQDTPDPSIDGQTTFLLPEIDSVAGAVLVESDGRNALILKGQLNHSTQAGRFTIEYLKNGLTMSYGSCDFLLNYANGEWSVQNAYTGAPVTEIKVITSLLGISTIEGICPAS